MSCTLIQKFGGIFMFCWVWLCGFGLIGMLIIPAEPCMEVEIKF